MPKIIGGAQTVVEHDGLKIDELAGNVATSSDRISIAKVSIGKPCAEPWLTLHYDEWICVTKGRMVLLFGDGSESLEVTTGQTVFIAQGERFKPTFPDADTEYIPVCLPAFAPHLCIREEEGGSEVAANLAKLHSKETAKSTSDDPKPEVLYHMCQVKLWEEAKRTGAAYFPPTFEVDGLFTHATAVPSRLITTANHFYQGVAGEWVCLRFTRTALRKHGIVVRDEEAKPVGDTPVGETWGSWVCPHILGGIPPAVVDTEFPMSRDAKGAYLAIEGLDAAKA